MTSSKPRKKAAVNTEYCVACGVCMKNCPVNAIQIISGVYAEVHSAKCIGCSKCTKACPASTINMQEERRS